MGDVLKSINDAMGVVIAWIYAPFVTNMWMGSKLHTSVLSDSTTINNFIDILANKHCQHANHQSRNRSNNKR